MTPPLRGGLAGWVRSHPAPRFAVAGALSVAVDLAVLRVLHGSLHVQLLLATTLSFTGSTLVNFVLNRNWAFSTGRDSRARHQFARFAALILANLLSTLAIVALLTWVGVYYLLAKLVATAVNAVANFFAYRHWVFR